MSDEANRRPLRSNLEPGTALWAGRRAHFRRMGLSDEDMLKPKIAVVNSSSELAVCFNHLDGVAAEVKAAIREAGGVPFEIRTTAPSDFITSAGRGGAYILPARDLIAHDIESQVEGALLDGMVCLASCDKTTPGQLMAAVRMNVPTIVVSCGYQASGTYRGQHVDIEDVFLKSTHVPIGRITVEELGEMADVAVQSSGVCAGMGTANSMHIVTEALGMTLPGHAPVAASSARMIDNARVAGRRIVAMVAEDLKPRDVITVESLENAVKVTLAISGSINCVKHLQGIANEAGIAVEIGPMFARFGHDVPLLTAVRPNGATLIDEFDDAGGARAVMKRLESVLVGSARSVCGSDIAAVLDATPEVTSDVIRPLDNPLSTRPALTFVQGNLLPGGGIVRLGGVEIRSTHFRGRARTFTTRDEALAAIKAGKVQPGDVVVMRGLGVVGGPGMALTSAVVFALDAVDLTDEVAVITEGQISGLVNKGLVVGEASPEAASGGPLALVLDGDAITIDVDRRVVDLEVTEAELERRRREGLGYRLAPHEKGWLGVYQKTVRPVHEGATMDRDDD